MLPINNHLSMQFVDVDGDSATFASSTARLTMPAGSVVLWAGLHWNGATTAPSDPAYGSLYQAAPPSVGDRFQVLMRTPGSGAYRPLSATPSDGVSADSWDSPGPGAPRTYGGFVDVTAAVKTAGSGDYTVADVQSCRGFAGRFGSWSL